MLKNLVTTYLSISKLENILISQVDQERVNT